MAFVSSSGGDSYKILIEADGSSALKAIKQIDQTFGQTSANMQKEADRIRQGLAIIGKESETTSKKVDSMEASMDRLSKVAAKAAGIDGFPQLSKYIKEAFDAKNTKGAEHVADRLRDIGEAAVKTGIPLKEVEARIKQFAATANASAQSTGGFSLGLTKLAAGVFLAKQAFGAISGVISQVGETLQRAGEVEGITASFKTLQESVGNVADKSLAGLRTATRGLISDYDLMQKANQAVLLGLPTKGFEELSAAAIKLGRAMGRTATESINDLTLGIGRQSRLILDNLGVIVRAEEANQKYAQSHGIVGRELDDNEKKLAFTAEAFAKITEKAANSAAVTDDAATAFTRLNASLGNLESQFLKGVNSVQGLAAAINNINNVVKSDAIANWAGKATGALIALGAQGTSILLKLSNDFLTWNTRQAQMMEGFRALQKLDSSKTLEGKAVNLITSGISSLKEKLTSATASAKDLFAGIYQGALKSEAATKKLASNLTQKFGLDLPIVRKELEKIAKLKLTGAILPTEAVSRVTALRGELGLTTEEMERLDALYFEIESSSQSSMKKAATEAGKLQRKNEQLTKSVKGAKDAFADTAKQILNIGRSASGGVFEGIFQDFAKGGITATEALAKITSAVDGISDVDAIKDLTADLREAGPVIKEIYDRLSEGYDETLKRIQKLRKEGKPAEFLPGALGDKDLSTGEDLFPSKLSGLAGGFSSYLQKALDIDGVIADTISTLSSGLASGIQNIASSLRDGKIDKAEMGELVVGATTTIGAAIGAYFGSGNPEAVQLGAQIGQFVGQVSLIAAEVFGKDSAGTTARKNVDKFFADVFDKNRLSIVVGDQVRQITDLVFQGNTPFGGEGVELGKNAFSFLEGLTPAVQGAFKGVGAAFEELLGVGEEFAGQLAAVFANNIGGSLNNLQLLVYSTGKSFTEMKELIVNAFLNAKLSAKDAKTALDGIRQVMTKGIPDGVGRTVQAFQNLQAAGVKGGRASTDAIRDLAYEIHEVGGKTLDDLRNNLIASGQFTAAEVDKLFTSLAQNGIGSLEQLATASDERLIGVVATLQDLNFAFKDPVNGAAELVEKLNELENKEVTLKIHTEVDENFNKVYDLYNGGDTAANTAAGGGATTKSAKTTKKYKALAATSGATGGSGTHDPFDPETITDSDFATIIENEPQGTSSGSSKGGKKSKPKPKGASEAIQEIRRQVTETLAGSERVAQLQSQLKNGIIDKKDAEAEYASLLKQGLSLISQAENAEKKAEELRKKKVVDLRKVLELETTAKNARAEFDKLTQRSPTPISFDDIQKLVTGTERYAAILDALNKKEITSEKAQELLIGTYNDAEKALNDLNQAQERYDIMLAKLARGEKISAEELTSVQAALYGAKKAYDEFGSAKAGAAGAADDPAAGFFDPRAIKNTTDVVGALGGTGKMDPKASEKILEYMKTFKGDANELGVVLRSVGVNAEDAKKLIIDSFKQGQISAVDAKKAIDSVGQALGEGIPDQVGATVAAFDNFIKNGLEGGEFTIDALKDIFAEAAELGITDLGTLQENLARSGKFTEEEVAKLFETLYNSNINTLDDAKKITDETAINIIAAFAKVNAATASTVDKAAAAGVSSFDQFRTFLTNSGQFTQNQINALFKSLEEHGVMSFQQFAGLSEDLKNKILVDMDTAGGGFDQTSTHVKSLLGEINQLNKDIFITLHVKTETDAATDDFLTTVGESDGVVNNYITNITNTTPESSAPVASGGAGRNQKPVGAVIRGVVGPPKYGRWKRLGPGQYERIQ